MTKVANPINKEDVDLNTYEGIAEFYDELMTKGYYDYDELTKELSQIMGERREILELGVGTGLVAELLLKENSKFSLTGIDNTEAMIKQAQDRLGDKISYELQDVTKLDLPKKYEGAFSVGGCWYFIDNGSEKSLQLCSHIDDLETSKKGLQKVVEHLEPGGILALALQPAHTNYSKELSNELIYSQEIFESPNGFTKHYCFKNKEKVVAEQMYSYLVVSENDSHDFFANLGCKPIGLNSSRKFFIYQKR